MKTRLPLLALLAFAAFLFFLDLGELGLTDRDEGSNAEAAREMVESGNWLYPTLNGEPRFAKPILIYWLTSAAYLLLGVSEFSARFPSALFAVGLIVLQYRFAYTVKGPLVAMLAGLMLLLNIEMLAIGRMALTDSVLIFWTTLALYGFWLGLHGTGRQRHYIWLFYVGMGLATLTKGPVGIIVPLLAVGPYLFLTRRWPEFWRRGFPVAGLVLFLAIAVPWYAAMLAIHGSRYTASAQADTVGRFLNVIGGHDGTLLFYIPVLLIGLFPWSGFLPAALYEAIRRWRTVKWTREADDARRQAELELFAALWVMGVFVFFTVSATRLPHYIGPLFPPATLLIGIYWVRMLGVPATSGLKWALRLTMLVGYLLGFALVSASSLYSTFLTQIAKEFPAAAQADPGNGPFAAGLILLVGMGLVGYFGFSDDRRAGAIWTSAVTFVLVVLIAVEVTLPRFSRYFIDPPHQLSYIAGLNLKPEEELIVYGPPKPSVLFYAKRRAVMIKPGEEGQMKSHLTAGGRTMILLPSRLKARLPAEADGFSPLLDRYGYTLLANQPIVNVPQPQSPLPPNPHGL